MMISNSLLPVTSLGEIEKSLLGLEIKPKRQIDPLSLSSFSHSSPSGLVSEAGQVLQKTQAEISHAINNPEPKVLEKLSQVNAKLQKKGRAPIDLKKTTQEIQKIYDQRGLTKKQKKKQIDAIRKRLKLSKGEMKTLFTKRLGKIYKQAAKSLKSYQKNRQGQLANELKQAEKLYGKDSAQVQSIKNKMSILHTLIDPQRQYYDKKGDFFNNLYPSFWSKLGGFFKAIGSGLKKAFNAVTSVLKHIPVIGKMVSSISGIVRTLGYLFTGKIGSFFKSLGQNILTGVKNFAAAAQFIPGIGTMASWASQLITIVEQIAKKKSTPPVPY